MSDPQEGDIVRVTSVHVQPKLVGALGVVTSVRQWAEDHKYSWVIVDFPMDLRRWMKISSVEVIGHVGG